MSFKQQFKTGAESEDVSRGPPANIARNLIKTFETGRYAARSEDAEERRQSIREEITSIAVKGLTKELVQTYESITQEPEEPKWYKIHVVYAHWERNGTIDGALLDTTIAVLSEQGHSVTVSDLYTQGFNPLPSKADITGDYQQFTIIIRSIIVLIKVDNCFKMPKVLIIILIIII